MARSVTEWIGKTDDTPVPPHVRLRVFRLFKGVCPKCTRKMVPKQWECDHIKALINGGENRESNLWPLCKTPCHSDKTKVDVAEKSRVYQRAISHVGIQSPRAKIKSRPFSKSSPQNTATRPIRKWSPYAESR